MRCQAALWAVLLGLLPATARSTTLDHDWARVYNPAGNESVLGMWPAPGGGVDIAVENAGKLVYIRYNQAGTLTAERATGIGISSMPFRVLASDGAYGLVLAGRQDSVSTIGLVVARVSASGQVLWRNPNGSLIYYPKAIQVRDGKVYLGVDSDFFTSYDPSLFVLDLQDGAHLGESVVNGFYFRISDIEVVDDGRIYLTGYDNDECHCFTWMREFDAQYNVLKTNPYPGHAFAQFEGLASRNVLLATSAASQALSTASFAVTWFNVANDTPTANVDSRDFVSGGARADILIKDASGVLFAGEHDAGGGAAELILGTAGDFGGVDLDLLRTDATKSYDAIQLSKTGNYILLLGKQSNVNGTSPARVVLLLDQNRAYQDQDVEGNMPNPSSMAIGSDGGVYTVGTGGAGIVLTRLVITAGPTAVAEEETQKAPQVSRLGIPSPNPAKSSVRLDYEVAGSALATTMDVYDPAGRLVARLIDGKPAAGAHVANWDVHDVAKGVYFVRFKSGTTFATRKLVIE
jgi:hypothetical protein